MVEVNFKEPTLYNGDSGFKAILKTVWPKLSDDVSSRRFPSFLAQAIESHLNERFRLKARIYTVSFVGLAVESGRIFVSWTGLFRTHLTINGRVVQVTRDHNLVDDRLPTVEISTDPRLREIDKHTPTRQLLAVRGSGDRTWESAEWFADSDFEIIICSDSYHKFGKPEDYVFAFSSLLDQGQSPEPVGGGGLITKIAYTRERLIE
ncbi:MAG: hypothetical protein AB7V18_02075 [Pyrinomonadaceae bacterium]